MLQPMNEFDTGIQLGAMVHSWVALDKETGAFLMRSSGRTKFGDTKYVLILPNETPIQRKGYFTDYTWEDKNRKFLRAYALDEAISQANEKLEKMIRKQ